MAKRTIARPWGAYGKAQGTSPAVPGRAVPSTDVSVGHPLRDAYPGGIPPVVDLTGAVIGQMLRCACHAPVVWNRRPMRKPIAAAPRPIATICSPFLRQSPVRVTA